MTHNFAAYPDFKKYLDSPACLNLEAKILGMRWCVKPKAVAAWMQARGFKTAMDLMVFSLDHQEAMNKALADFWGWAT